MPSEYFGMSYNAGNEQYYGRSFNPRVMRVMNNIMDVHSIRV